MTIRRTLRWVFFEGKCFFHGKAKLPVVGYVFNSLFMVCRGYEDAEKVWFDWHPSMWVLGTVTALILDAIALIHLHTSSEFMLFGVLATVAQSAGMGVLYRWFQHNYHARHTSVTFALAHFVFMTIVAKLTNGYIDQVMAIVVLIAYLAFDVCQKYLQNNREIESDPAPKQSHAISQVDDIRVLNKARSQGLLYSDD